LIKADGAEGQGFHAREAEGAVMRLAQPGHPGRRPPG
jgi:hypothetical protein